MLSASNRMLTLMALVGVIALFAWLARPNAVAALPGYTTATGQPCSTCHVNPAGGGPLTAVGTAFQAIPNRAADPAGAFTQATAPRITPTPGTTTPGTTVQPTPTAPSVSTLPKAGDGSLVGIFAAAGLMLVILGLAVKKATAQR